MINSKTKIKFTDIAGMLDRDEMKEIVGGSGGYQVGTGGGSNFVSGTALGGGFTGGYQAQSSFNGAGYSYSSSGSSSYGSSNFGSGSGGSMSSFTETANGYTTSNPSDISAMYAMLYGSSTHNGANSNFSQIQQYAQGQSANNLQLYGTVLDNVNVNNAYQAPSSVYVNPFSQYNSFDPYSNTNSIFGSSGNIGSSSSYLQQGVPKTDCFFQVLGWISQMNGDTAHDANYYASIYAFTHPNTSVIPNFNLSSFNKPTTDGVSLDQASAFAGVFFKATDYSGASNQFLSNWINPSSNPSGDNQLIGVYRTDNGTLHAIAVTSISGTTVNFYDPQNPIRTDTSASITTFTNFYGITANK
jgi:hypothetical protein